VIERLQRGQGGSSFNNMFSGIGQNRVGIDWAAHARALGCRAEPVTTVAELEAAFERARASDRTTVLAIPTAPDAWTPGGAFWEVGVPEVSTRPEVAAARERLLAGKAKQRIGW
jgi:3D-(3,5/4)-trihydroxycyclohexane-1,2-dione acylhydrolase (decyclizing)